jgi:hypothetical protein
VGLAVNTVTGSPAELEILPRTVRDRPNGRGTRYMDPAASGCSPERDERLVPNRFSFSRCPLLRYYVLLSYGI